MGAKKEGKKGGHEAMRGKRGNGHMRPPRGGNPPPRPRPVVAEKKD